MRRLEVADGIDPAAAADAVARSGWPTLVEARLHGPFGHTAEGLSVLEALASATDLGLAAEAALAGVMRAGDGFDATPLAPPRRRLASAFQIVVMADALVDALGQPDVEGALAADGLSDLLATEPAGGVAERILSLACAFAQEQGGHPKAAAAAFATLLRRGVVDYARRALRPQRDALDRLSIDVAGVAYLGLSRLAAQDAGGLMRVSPKDVVGNDTYLEAGLRLARDVAGFDLERGRNPKRFNPVLFGLGAPGCGKTLTGHAIGRYFLDYCAERGVPARFRVVRRTDWASSYQNASAANLVRIFRDEVHGAPGVCGVYWPDIDTALASRDDPGLRAEEKQNLGALFGLFDGTVVPRDGKWFVVCDANTLRFDAAALSRLAQDAHRVEGPTTPEHYARLMRDVLLGDAREWLPTEPRAWLRLGEQAARLRLSGRAIQGACARVRGQIQDFEYPEAWFEPGADRETLLRSLCRPVDEAAIARALTGGTTG